jgi:FkbM family methyltransferase
MHLIVLSDFIEYWRKKKLITTSKILALREKYKKKIISKSEIKTELKDIRNGLVSIDLALSTTKIINKIEFVSGGNIIFHFDDFMINAAPHIRYDIISNILIFGDYERFILKVIDRLCPNDGVFIDIGANVGYLSLFMARQQTRVIYSFEASSITYSALLDNIKLNKSNNINTFNLYLGENDGHTSFYYDMDNPAASSAVKLIDLNEHSSEIVSIRRLDSIVNDLNRVDLIKIDVEGSELFVIRGAFKTIAKHRPFIVCEMLRKWSTKYNYHPNDIINSLIDLHYVVYEIVNDSLRSLDKVNENTIGTNFVFVPHEKIDVFNGLFEEVILKSE